MTPAICGVGTSHFGKQEHVPLTSLVWDAVSEAFNSAGSNQVDAVFVGNVFSEPGTAQRVLRSVGIRGVPIVSIEAACASGTSAFHEAVESVRLERYGTVLALGYEQLSSIFDGPIEPQTHDPEGRTGLAMPALYAMAASRYLSLGHLTERDLAEVSVKNHAHAMGNSRAQYGGIYSVREVLESPMIADPLTLLQCCPISDGAAAAIIGAKTSEGDIEVLSSIQRSGGLWDHRSKHVWGFEIVQSAARQALEAADVAIEDVDVFEVHDAFTIGELVTTEALGLARVGEGALLIRSGATQIGGAHPVNPSGGLLSRGHPLGATGLAQIAEVVWQLRGEAHERQVKDAAIGLVETMGGGVSGLDGNACVVTVLKS